MEALHALQDSRHVAKPRNHVRREFPEPHLKEAADSNDPRENKVRTTGKRT